MSELLGRAVKVLDVLGRAETDLAIREIASRVSLPKSSVQRLLRSLVQTEMAIQDPTTRRYRLGPRTLALGMAYQRKVNVRAVAMPYMARLRDRTGETVGLSIPVGEEMLHVDQVESSAELRRTFEIGRPYPLWAGAPSRLVLAGMPDEDVERIAKERKNGGVSPVRPLSPEDLMQAVRRARNDGYAAAFEETIAGVNTVAAPVVGDSNQVVATISVTGPTVRFSWQAMEAILHDLLHTAEAISIKIGGRARMRPAMPVLR
ncbi:MAG TPA: IclR family transcriptional regulator [Actinopolymorphaceae bacterium]